MAVATGDETKMNGGGLGTSFAAAKEPVLPADRQTTQRAFGCAIVDRQCAVGGVSHQRLPVIEQVIHRPAEGCFGQELGLFRFQPGVQRCQYRHRALLAHVDDAIFQLLTWQVAPLVGAVRLELTLDLVQLPNPGLYYSPLRGE